MNTMASIKLQTRHPDLFSATHIAELVVLAKGLYPHEGLRDEPYQRAVAKVIDQAAIDAALWHLLRDGLRDLHLAASTPLLGMDPGAVNCLLHALDRTAFFESLRTLVLFHLYDDHEVWEFIGYPGSSFEHGGYLNRGFNDLDWLPEPRTAEAPEPLIEIGPIEGQPQKTNDLARTPR